MGYKSKPNELKRIVAIQAEYGNPYYQGKGYTNYFDYWTGTNVISYGDGKKLNGRWPWKVCEHNRSTAEPVCATGFVHYDDPPGWYNRSWTYRGAFTPGYDGHAALPNTTFDDTCMLAVLDQINLNSKDNVLLYSGILQAVPLLGAITKLNAILKSVGRYVTKELRRKPFTTVLQSLISADFIDRFVISPTLDDARRFQDACDYVLRVINTAQERNAHRFALSATAKTVHSKSESTFWTNRGDLGVVYGTRVDECYSESKAFMLLEARYDLLALDPIKMWAQRVGLTRPLESAWDLVPFSFVVDYFTRAGDFIAALSDEMSNVQGLEGTITKIHDLWGSHLRRSVTRFKAERYEPDIPGWAANAQSQVAYSDAVYDDSRYTRFRIPDPFSYLLSLSDFGDYLTINTRLSSTRKRTLLELFIQSRLRRKSNH